MFIDDLSGYTVLLVDDEVFSRNLVAGMLEKMGRPNILRASNGNEALAVFSENDVDIIISDFNMPEFHGLQFLRAVRTWNNDAKRSTPFAMLTGYSERKLVDLALVLGINAFFIKPVSQAGLKSRIINMLLQVDSENWLKDRAIYESIDVNGVLEEIANPDGKGRVDGVQSIPSIDQSLISAQLSVQRKTYNSGPIEVRGVHKVSSAKFGKKDLREEDMLVSGSEPEKAEAEAEAEDKSAGIVSTLSSVFGLGKSDKPVDADDGSEKNFTERLCPLDELPHEALITRDIITADGSLFMHGGTQLTPSIISILHDLNELGHPVESVWIED